VGIIHLLTLLFTSSTDNQIPATGQSDHSCALHVRPACADDLSGVAAILADSFHSPQGMFGWAYPLLRLGIYEDLRNRLRSASPQHVCLIATVDGELAGTVEIGLRSSQPWHKSSCAYLSNLAVHPERRRQGVAGQLLLNCEQAVLSWGFQDLYLHVLENNYQARQLYCKLGYRLHSLDFNWSAWLLGRPRQLLLHKHLSKDVETASASSTC